LNRLAFWKVCPSLKIRMGAGKSQSPLICQDDLMAKVSHRYHRLPMKVTDDYVVNEEVLGTGFNGSVYKAESRHTEGVYAVKGLDLESIDATQRSYLKAETEIFLSMDHPHVARLVDVYEESSKLFLVMECMEGGELFSRVKEKKGFKEPEAAHTLWQVLLSLNYLHARGIVHRDVKLENFLYEAKDSDHLKLIDFGFSLVTDLKKKMTVSAGGTPQYAAPEVFDDTVTCQCDMWSVGVVAFILLLGYMPFGGADMEANIKAGKYMRNEERWKKISPDAANFIEALLVVDPEKRLSAVDALKHPFISKRDQAGRRYITPLGKLETDAMAKLEVSDEMIKSLCDFSKASRFRRACMALISWSLTPDERGQVAHDFIELDLKRDGTIPFPELHDILSRRCKAGDKEAEDIVAHLGSVIETDFSDRPGETQLISQALHFSDFLAAMIGSHLSMHEDHFVSMFRRFDKEKTGTITHSDLGKVLGREFGPDEIALIIYSVDPDGSGQISYNQFLTYLKGDAKVGHKTDDVTADGGKKAAPKARALISVALSAEDKQKAKDSIDLLKDEEAKGAKKSRTCVLL